MKITTAALPQYENAKIAWEKARDHAVKKAKGDRGAIKFALDNLGPPPAAPLTPMLTCPEPTYEGLCKHLVSGQPSIGIFSAEGGQFIGGHGMTRGSKAAHRSGSVVPVGRRDDQARSGGGWRDNTAGRRVAMHLMAQPDVAAVMLSDRSFWTKACCRAV